MSCGDLALNAATSSADVETTTESGGDGDDAPVGAAVSVAGELAQLAATIAARSTSGASVLWTAEVGRDLDGCIGTSSSRLGARRPRRAARDTYFV